MRGCVDINIDIFLFNTPKSVYVNDVVHTLLENIKDGKAIAGKFDTRKMIFTKPNVILILDNFHKKDG